MSVDNIKSARRDDHPTDARRVLGISPEEILEFRTRRFQLKDDGAKEKAWDGAASIANAMSDSRADNPNIASLGECALKRANRFF